MKNLALLFLGLFLTTGILAQDRDARRAQRDSKIESLKVAFITNQLSLTEEESKNFWPLYNDFQAERKALRKAGKKGKKGKNRPNFAEMSDAELEAMIEERFNIEEKELSLKRKYFKKLKTVLPIRKIAKLHQAEREFKKKVLDQMRERRGRGTDGKIPPGRNPEGRF